MNPVNILIVEDESIVAMEIQSYIEKLHYPVIDICSNGHDAIQICSREKIDIVLMDICIKGDIDGIETSAIIKEKYPLTKIIFLTAHMDEYNIDRAVELNPIAYLSKPFQREELHAFLKIAAHKISTKQIDPKSLPSCIILDEEFCYDKKSTTLFYCSESIHLTKKESELLDILIMNKNNIVDFYTIANLIWPDKDISTNTIRTLMKRLREKLKHKFIETLSSQGYRLII
jgi:DNA-binding response OmpR family regulator